MLLFVRVLKILINDTWYIMWYFRTLTKLLFVCEYFQSLFFVTATALRTLMFQQLHQTPIRPSTLFTRDRFRLRMRRSHVDAQILLRGILFVAKCACEFGLFGIRGFWCLRVGLSVVVGDVGGWNSQGADLTADVTGWERSWRDVHLENIWKTCKTYDT